MIRKKILQGLPHDILQSFLSTLSYSSPGYMSDWAFNWIRTLNVPEINIDVLAGKISPQEASEPLQFFVPPLKKIIENKLQKHGLPAGGAVPFDRYRAFKNRNR